MSARNWSKVFLYIKLINQDTRKYLREKYKSVIIVFQNLE